jgi:LysM repeat protein
LTYDAAVRSRVLGAPLVAVCCSVLTVACSDDDGADAGATLPPIATTTTVPPTVPPPPPTQPRFYEVQPGDTLIEIATAYGLPIQAIMEMNGIVDQNKIFAGQILELPLASAIVATTLPTVAPAPTTTPGVPPTTTAAP